MKNVVVMIAVIFALIGSQAHATVFFVSSAKGLDTNTGLTTITAFKTLQKAAGSTHPGDTVDVMPGTYTDQYDADILNISTSGTPGSPITYKSYIPQAADITLGPNNWSGIRVASGTQYIVIDGFEITGYNQSLTWAGANKARQSGLGVPLYNGDGVWMDGSYDPSTKVVNAVAHIVVQNCFIHDCAEGGIGSGHSDYLTIRNNTVWNCAWYSSYNGSGISTWVNANTDNNATDIRDLIQNNVVYDCRCEIGCPGSSQWTITDGNGIIIDDADCRGSTGIPYTGKVVVENNLVYNCGGRGINVFCSNNVSVIHNTLYHNANGYSVADVHIAAGSAGSPPFVADNGFAGGATDSMYTGPVDTSLIKNVAPAPLVIYQSERYGVAPSGFTYTVHVRPVCSYEIALHFTEDRWNQAGQRLFNVSVNGNPWLTNFDIFATAGAMHRAVAEVCRDTSDPNGNITLDFTPGSAGVPKVDGIEVLSDTDTPNADISFVDLDPPIGGYVCADNIIWSNVGTASLTEWNIAPSKIVCDSNLYYNGTTSHPVVEYGDKNALWTNPLFFSTDIANIPNFHLRLASPALGSANRTFGQDNNRGCY
jgi:hypothetical protein